jgi:hypothetical protein
MATFAARLTQLRANLPTSPLMVMAALAASVTGIEAADLAADDERHVRRKRDERRDGRQKHEAADAGADDVDFLEGMDVQIRYLERPLALEPQRVFAKEAGADRGDQRGDVLAVEDEPA